MLMADKFIGGGNWKVIACTGCGNSAPAEYKLLRIEKACAEFECKNCGQFWWEHPWGKSCAHRKIDKNEFK